MVANRAGRSKSMRSFQHRNFKLFFISNFLSNVGGWAQRVAQDWLVLQLTHSGRELGIVTGLQFAPSLLFSVYGGSLADRLNKRKLLMITHAGSALCALLLGVLVMSHSVQLWHVYVIAVLLGTFGALDAPTRQAFTSEMVGKSDVANAVSLNSANFNAGRLVGPGLSGLLIAWFGTGPSFIFNAASYIVVLGALVAVDESALFLEKKQEFEVKSMDALRYVRARPQIMAVMATVFFMGTFGLNFQIFNALMATQIFHRGPAIYGLLGSVIAIGSLTAGIASARMDRKRGPRFIMAGAMIFGSWLAVVAWMPTFLLYLVTLPIAGFFALTTMINANSFVQNSTDAHIKGRVMGLYLLSFMGGTPFGSPLIGWMCQKIGVRETISACGAIAAGAALAISLVLKSQQAKSIQQAPQQ